MQRALDKLGGYHDLEPKEKVIQIWFGWNTAAAFFFYYWPLTSPEPLRQPSVEELPIQQCGRAPSWSHGYNKVRWLGFAVTAFGRFGRSMLGASHEGRVRP